MADQDNPTVKRGDGTDHPDPEFVNTYQEHSEELRKAMDVLAQFHLIHVKESDERCHVHTTGSCFMHQESGVQVIVLENAELARVAMDAVRIRLMMADLFGEVFGE